MFLSKLEIFGFKSFATKTTLNFTRGITGVVGPNGSGKTNIVDAIRWCLGEQKSSTLRSDKMENVIFNGTNNKKPMGMSEVSLTLVNDRGILPSEYTEITITRRIFRSGESEYLLNKNVCRLKDITNLFMDTGMATNAYSVIELKMVENILSSKAEERRKMFEEAAGVNKYKLRRRLSLKRLDEVKSDLTRVNDIVSEVEKNVRSLERQSKKANRYNHLQSELREKEIDLAERELANLTLELSTLQKQKDELTFGKDGIDDQIKSSENELVTLREAISEKETKLREKLNELSSLSGKIYTNKKNVSVADERKKSLEENIKNYKAEIEELKTQNEESNEKLKNYNETKIRLKSLIEEKKSFIETNEKVLEEKKDHLTELKAFLKSKNEDSVELFQNYSSKENRLSNLKNYQATSNDNINKLNEKIQKLTSDIAKSVGYLENLEQEKSKAKDELSNSESLYSKRLEEKESLEKKLSSLKEKELDEKGTINNLKTKIDFYQSLITNLEGISGGSKILLESEGWTDKEKTLFADVGNTETEFQLALEVALKNVLNSLLIDDLNDLQKAIEYLKKNDLGKASFYLLGNGTKKKGLINKLQNFTTRREAKKIEKKQGFIAWAKSLVTSTEKWKPYFEKILNNTAVVKDLDTAIKLHNEFKGFNFSTLDGDFIQKDGVIVAGSFAKIDQTLFGRKKLLEELKDQYPKYEANLRKLQDFISETENEISRIDLKVLSDQGKIILNDINNIEKQIAKFEFEKNKASEEIEKTQQEIHDLVNQINTYDTEIITLTEEINLLTDKKQNISADLSTIEKEVSEAEEDYNAAQSELNKHNLELERLKGELHSSINNIKRTEENLQSIKETIDRRNKDITSAYEEISGLDEMISSSNNEYEVLLQQNTELEKSKDELEVNVNEMKNKMTESEKLLNRLRNERQSLSDNVYKIDLRNNELSMKIENLRNSIQEEYSLELQLKDFEDLHEFNFSEISDEVLRLKEKIRNLGPINLLAYNEYEEEKERLDFLHQQRDDLIESEKDLINTIKNINESAQNVFFETFEEIRKNFINIFQTLFDPEDEADLKLEEGVDPLEAKIEIIAKPKGKRPTSIELLSGGEKTLTATALLFAIYLVKPSPFCIMDEVDAPLDDANVDRFTKLLKEFSDKTQFIIVTHNKRTMEASETMYGVTMQEEGISKLVGVQFNDQINVPA